MTDQPKVTKIDVTKVLGVYSGLPGCACGCRGKRTYPSDPAIRAQAAKHRGYPVDDEEVSDRTVATIVRNMLATGDARLEGDHVWAETPNRLYIVTLARKEA